MSGLLDKANKVAEDKKEDPKQVEAVIEDRAPTGFAEANSSHSGLNITALKFQIVASVGFLVTMIMIFFVDTIVLFGDITFDDFFIPGLIVWWLVFNGEDLKEQVFEWKKLGISAGGFLLVTGMMAGVAVFSAGGGVTIASAKLDGSNDELDLSFYGPSGADFTVEVMIDGESMYSKDLQIGTDRVSHSINLDEFWDGNSKNRVNKTLLEYEVVVTSNGDEDSTKITDLMNREVDTGYVKVTEVYDTVSDNDGNERIYTGIAVEMIVGIGNPGAEYSFASDYFSGTPPKTIVSDWTVTLTVKKGESTTYTYQDITADEGFVTGIGDFWSGWVAMPGTEAGNLARDDFYDGDGCYTFEVSIQNELGDDTVDSSSKIEFSWESNEAGTSNEPASSENC